MRDGVKVPYPCADWQQRLSKVAALAPSSPSYRMQTLECCFRQMTHVSHVSFHRSQNLTDALRADPTDTPLYTGSASPLSTPPGQYAQRPPLHRAEATSPK